MRKMKWIFFGYLGLVAALIVGITVSFALTPKRDPNTLYSIYAADIKTLDPAEIGDVPSSNIAGSIFECPYNYDYELAPDKYQLIPELAVALPEVSGDAKTYTIKLRRGVHYYDPDGVVWEGKVGPEVKAGDFIFAWKRVMNFHLASPNTSLFENVAGIEAWSKYTETTPENQIDWDKPVEGLEAPDDYTIRVRFSEPFPQFVNALATLPSAPMSRDVYRKYGEKVRLHPVGTGPYYLSEKNHRPQQRIVFEKNPAYRGGPSVDPAAPPPEAERLPHVARVQLDYFDEDLPPWFMFRQGLLDVGGIPKDVFGQAIRSGGELTDDMRKQGVDLKKAFEPTVFYYGFNMQDPVVGRNPPLRQAMSMALNRAEFVELFRNGRGRVPLGPIPPGFPTFDPNLKNPYSEFNLEAARAKLKEAEAVQGGPIPPIRLLVGGTDTTFRQMGDFMKRNMAQIGIKLEVDYTNWSTFLDEVEKKKTAQFYQLGWNTDWPDEQNILQLFWSKNIAVGGLNAANYSNPEFDALYEQARVMADSPRRRELYKQMQDIVDRDCPWILLYYPEAYQLYYRWVENLKLVEYLHGGRAHLSLNPALRQQDLSRRSDSR